MKLTRLDITNFRNIKYLTFYPCHAVNLLYGANGSGKTSVLEAIYYIAMGRSFRTRYASRIVQYEAEQFSIFSQLQSEAGFLAVGIERYRNGEGKNRIANQDAASLVEVSKLLPVQLLSPNSLELLYASKLRRQFIDWGVFHSESSFLAYWQRANRALKQRNAAIKAGKSIAYITLWDHELVPAAQKINEIRKNYLEQFIPLFLLMANQLLGEHYPIKVNYKMGWPSEGVDCYEQVLAQSLSRDRELGYTKFGPHRADLSFTLMNLPVQETLSQGQLKLLIYALHIAQGLLLKQQTGKDSIYLLDDLPAELDAHRLRQITEVLAKINAQIFITATSLEAIDTLRELLECKLFHVKHGNIEEVPMEVPRETYGDSSIIG